MTITVLYASVLALWFFILSIRVIRHRGTQNIALGDGGNNSMLRRIRAHSNFAEYAPIILLLMGLLEFAGVGPVMLHVIGLLLLAGRFAHGWALSFTDGNVPGRVGGMILTFAALIIAAVRGLLLALGIPLF